jgi:hypothetical protein
MSWVMQKGGKMIVVACNGCKTGSNNVIRWWEVLQASRLSNARIIRSLGFLVVVKETVVLEMSCFVRRPAY